VAGSVLITGGSSGIGLATARRFAERGWSVVLAARSEAALIRAAAQVSGAQYRAVDVTDQQAVEQLFADCPPFEVVVHAAMVMGYGRVEELDPEVFRAVTRTGVDGTFHVARAALASFRRHGRGKLIVINSLVGHIVSPQLGAYATAKWAQAALIRTLQLELRGQDAIRVCSIVPGAVNTPVYRQAANVTGRRPRPPLPVDQPDAVAAAVLRCLDRPRDELSVGLANRFIRFGFTFVPGLYNRLVGPLLTRLSLLDEPTEPATGNVLAPVPGREAEADRWTRRWSISSRH